MQPLQRQIPLGAGQVPLGLLLPGAVKIVYQGSENPGGVVGAQHIHIAGKHLGGIVLHDGHNGLFQTLTAVPLLHIVQNGGAVGVVHAGVQHPVYKVPAADAVGLLVGGILPHLADEQGIGLQLPQPLFKQKYKLVGQFIHHIQPEAVGTQLQPVLQHRVGAGDDVFDEALVHLVHGGQGVEAPPAVVVIRPLVEGVPAGIRGVLGAVGSLASEGSLLVKVETVGAGVGIDPVQNHPDAPGVGGLAHGSKIRLRTQHGVGGLVIACIVTVAGKTLGDGIQVQNGGAQRGNILQFLRDTPEIAAEKVVVQHHTLRCGTPGDLLIPVLVDGIGLQLAGKVAAAGLMEPVGENLIDGSALCPVRGGKVRRNTAKLPAVPGFHIGVVALLEQAEAAGSGGDVKIVEVQPGMRQGELALVDVIGPTLDLVLHGDRVAGGSVLMIKLHHDLGGLDGGGNVNVKSTALVRGERPKGIFIHTLFRIV